MSYILPPYVSPGAKVMLFVDGENLAIRYGAMLEENDPPDHVKFKRNIYVWSDFLNKRLDHHNCEVIRKYYYTALKGDIEKIEQVEEQLRQLNIEAPCVFKKSKDKGSKRVDISLATDMLTHAFRKNYDIAVLVAGDEDYVPLVEAVMAEGRRVVVWFIKSGLSPKLKRKADFYYDMQDLLLEYNDERVHSKVYP
jgi:uncharacterized LabA/DUF88 family protein